MNSNDTTYRANQFRLAILAWATLLLCSCRSGPAFWPVKELSAKNTETSTAVENGLPATSQADSPPSPAPSVNVPVRLAPDPVAPNTITTNTVAPNRVTPNTVTQVAYHQPSLPPQAWTGAVPTSGAVINGAAQQVRSWQPPGIPGTWPRDEYIFDGGDRPYGAKVLDDWSIRGLNVEDTVAHYDTLDGRLIIKPTNKIAIYAPRFAAVRKVDSLVAYHQQEHFSGTTKTTSVARADELQIPTTAIQPVQPALERSTKTLTTYRERLTGIGLDNAASLVEAGNNFALHEDFQVIHNGTFKASEKARLAERIDAALIWTGHQAVQIFVDNRQVAFLDGSRKSQEVEGRQVEPGNPNLRIIKLASVRHARPGEIIDFTLRFDNLGDEPVGNVTVVDNLTTRLEYIQDSAQSTLKADFFTQQNERDSLVLRWEIIDPLPPGKGGILRFKCRVR